MKNMVEILMGIMNEMKKELQVIATPLGIAQDWYFLKRNILKAFG